MDMLNFDPETLTVEELAKLITYHNQRYWDLGEPEISDIQYDELLQALKRVAPHHPLLNAILTPNVHGSGKVHHNEPMLSLDKAYSLGEILEWAHKHARSATELLLVEPKYDGISANFDGITLSTRGDGEYGENVTDKLPLIELESPGYTGSLTRPARGEILIRKDDFTTLYANIRKKDGGIYKNPRNAVAGIMGLKDIGEMLVQHAKLTLVDYNLLSFPVKLNELSEQWETLLNKITQLPYPMDGIVLKFADLEFRRSLGSTAHHPRGEIAYKFTNQSCRTTLLAVEWSFGKNCLTPVALLKPVELSGITIKRASLHNAQNLLDMDIKIGDTVTVERAGDVIPYITASSPGETRKSPFIDNCPACDTKLTRRGPELICPNANCPGSKLQLLAAAVKNLGIDNLGESTLKKLIDICKVQHLDDLFKLTVMDLLRVPGFASKSATKLIGEIQKAREINDYQLLAALNIPGIGLNIARQMLENYTLEELRQLSGEELSKISGIGPERARVITLEFKRQSDYLDELLNGVTIRHLALVGNEPTICFTGKMPNKRSFYEKLAAQHGFRAVDTVNSTLNLLVAADPSAKGSKLNNAAKFNIQVLSLTEFLDKYSQEESDTLF